MNGVYADHLKKLNRRLQRHIDVRQPHEAREALQAIKTFAGDHPEYQQVFEVLRAEAAQRWEDKFGRSWRQELAASTVDVSLRLRGASLI